MLNRIFIAIGSNEGNRMHFLQSAIDSIFKKVGSILHISSVYETPAWGFDGNAFLNACLEIETDLPSPKVLPLLLEIEKELGRERTKRPGYQNRPIDIDILLSSEGIINRQELQVPHPELHNRKFVLYPLKDIAESYVHPVKKATVAQLIKNTTDTSEIQKYSEKLQNPRYHWFPDTLRYLAIEGNIGAGKTSLTHQIARDFNARTLLERFADNPFLPKFYEDQERYAFTLEMSFLADRYQQLQEQHLQFSLFSEFTVSDYYIFKSLIFAQVTLSSNEYTLYRQLFDIMYQTTPKPDTYIFLYRTTDALLDQIQKRGRSYEQNITGEYLQRINESYHNFIKTVPGLNVKIIDCSELDFVNRRVDYIRVLQAIRTSL